MMRGARWLTVWLLFGAASCRGPESYLRVTAGAERGVVSVAWRRFDPPPGRPPVILACMLHIGSPRFFTEVQAALDRAEVVLMEGVIRPRARLESAAPVPTIARDDADVAGPVRQAPRTSRSGQRIRALAEAFELVYQTDALVARDHFVAADMDAATFREESYRATSTGISLAAVRKDLGFAMYQNREAHPDWPASRADREVRRGLGRAILARALEPLVHSVPRPVALHLRREAVALRALDRVTSEGDVFLCWGFGHGPALARGLQRRGYVPGGLQWREVFAYEPAVATADAGVTTPASRKN